MCIFKKKTTNAGAQAVEDTKTTPRADARAATPGISAAQLAAMYGGGRIGRGTVVNPMGGSRTGQTAAAGLTAATVLGG